MASIVRFIKRGSTRMSSKEPVNGSSEESQSQVTVNNTETKIESMIDQSNIQSEVEKIKPIPKDQVEKNSDTFGRALISPASSRRQSQHDLGIYVCLNTRGVAYRTECSYPSEPVGTVRAFGRVKPLRMFDERGNLTDHVGKYAWMEVEISEGLYYLPLFSIDGDILFKHRNSASFMDEPTITESPGDEEEKDFLNQGSDDDSISDSEDSYSSESEDDAHPNEPKGEDLGLKGPELYGHRFLSKMGLGKYHAKFVEAKMGELAQMCDERQATDEILSAGIGFSAIQIQVFRLEVMNHHNGVHHHHHHGHHHRHHHDKDGDHIEEKSVERSQERGEEDDERDASHVEEDEDSKKNGLLAFAAQAFQDNIVTKAQDEADAKAASTGKGRKIWGILKGRITEARNVMLEQAEAERQETRRATQAADDLTKLFASIDFTLPPAPSPPAPSPLRLRSLSVPDLGRPDPRGVALDFKTRHAALEAAEMKRATNLPKRKVFKGISVEVPPGQPPGFVWTDGGVVIYVHKGKVVDGKVKTGWRLCEVNGSPIVGTAKYELVKRHLNSCKESMKGYALSFEPPDPKKEKLKPLGSAL